MTIILPDRLLPLGLPDLWLLVPLSEDVLEGGSDHGALELLGLLGPLLVGLFLDSLSVLPAVQNGPGHLAGIPPHQMGLVGLAIHETEGLEVINDFKAKVPGFWSLFLKHSPFRRDGSRSCPCRGRSCSHCKNRVRSWKREKSGVEG